jgi:hypothetical protein
MGKHAKHSEQRQATDGIAVVFDLDTFAIEKGLKDLKETHVILPLFSVKMLMLGLAIALCQKL